MSSQKQVITPHLSQQMLFKLDPKVIAQPRQAAISKYGSFSMMATEKANVSAADIARGSVVRVMRPESYWF
jgi:hypothetical protein